MMSKPPPSSVAPAGVPSGNGKYIALVVLLLLGVGGVVAWKVLAKDPPATVMNLPSASVSVPPVRPHDDDIPPPPPPEPSASAAPTAHPNVNYVASNGCEAKTCNGKNSPDLEAALSARARASKRCYNNALASDNTLQGKMSIALKIGSNGQVCSANIASNDLGSQQVAACVQNVFRASPFPSPAGGCVEATVPMNFVQQK
jgi:hypothetical protein